MVCPFCSHTELKVLDSRPARDGKAIRRRRECDSCGRRFTTFEEVERVHPILIKRDGSRQEFDREKLLRSIMIPTRKRNVSTSALNDLVDRVELKLFEAGSQEVSTRELGQWVLDELATIDSVAFIRFASVYHEFDEPDQFVNLVKSLARV